MDGTILAESRQQLYATGFMQTHDVLFDVTDALLTAPQARNFVELAQVPRFQRQWSRLYDALEDGRIDRDVLGACSPPTCPRRWSAPSRPGPGCQQHPASGCPHLGGSHAGASCEPTSSLSGLL